uniref:Uncharacterized protein n=1 Tax=Solanum tuberosum TaxID=4113 RepID=M1DRG2_SOLTU
MAREALREEDLGNVACSTKCLVTAQPLRGGPQIVVLTTTHEGAREAWTSSLRVLYKLFLSQIHPIEVINSQHPNNSQNPLPHKISLTRNPPLKKNKNLKTRAQDFIFLTQIRGEISNQDSSKPRVFNLVMGSSKK